MALLVPCRFRTGVEGKAPDRRHTVVEARYSDNGAMSYAGTIVRPPAGKKDASGFPRRINLSRPSIPSGKFFLQKQKKISLLNI